MINKKHLLTLLFTLLYISCVSQMYQPEELRYTFKIVILSEELQYSIPSKDSLTIYCLLHDNRQPQFQYKEITTEKKFNASNYKLYFLKNNFQLSSDCLNDTVTKESNIIGLLLNEGTVKNYIVAVKYERVVTKDEVRILPKKIFKIYGFHTSEFRKVMEDVLDTKSKRKIRRYLKKNPIKGDNYNLINEL